MRFHNRHGAEITSLEQWRLLGAPVGDDQWTEGRSAYELAADWVERDAAKRVRRLLALRPELGHVDLSEGIAEKKTRFDANPRGPRNHDLLVYGTTSAGPLVVAVEGKADEPFDQPLWRWRQRAMARTADTGAKARLDHLTKLFFGTTIDSDNGYPALGCMGYQLLSALAGTLADAKERSATHAVLLVHEFRTAKTDDKKHAVNARGLDDFVLRLSKGDYAKAGNDNRWITEPIVVRGDGDRMPKSLPVFVAKLRTNRPRAGVDVSR